MRVLIAGGGQVAALLAGRLIREANDLVIVENNADRCAQLEAQLDARIVQGSAAHVRTLRAAGVAEADLVIAVTDSDEVNLLTSVIAHVESPRSVKVARLRTHDVDNWREIMARSGVRIDLLIHPETDIADRVMRVVRVPGVSDIRDFADGAVSLFGMNVTPGSWLIGKSLEEVAKAGAPPNSLIAMIFRGQQVIIPRGADRIQDGDHLYVLTSRDNLKPNLAFLGIETREKLRRVFIVGGKQVSVRIATQLEAQGVAVRLFERDAVRSEKIAGLLRRTVVVHADGTDQRVLEEAGLAEADAFLAMTSDDEDNVIASLLARRVGVGKVVALINRLNYLPMVQLLGVNTTVSPRVAAVDRILQYVRKGTVLSVTTFREDEAEAIELVASGTSSFVGKRLRDIHFPRGAIVGAIVRPDGSVVVPRGNEIIHGGDRVILFALETVIPKLEAAFHAGRGTR
ncbi:MAG: Trk system potassium transporter TrkA [Vicinamibacteraceae bacterium]|nr:Trk system potassium transporter TrkA [Vicinamibacteraceae bacterium]